MQFKKQTTGLTNTTAIAGVTKITLNWANTYATQDAQYLPVVKAGADAASLTAVTANEAAPVAGTKTDLKNGDYNVYTYVTTYNITDGNSFFAFGAGSGACYITSIVIE